MRRYVSGAMPLPRLADSPPGIYRADLVLYDVDPLGESYEGRVYLNRPDADHRTPRDAENGFAGSFTIFGHGGCFGDDELHCAVHAPADPFDRRRLRGIQKQVKTVTVSDVLATLSGDTFTATIVAVVPGDDEPQPSDALDFERLRLLTYAH